MIVVDANLLLRTIPMCEKELTISFGKILLLILENVILGKVSSMSKLHLTKVTQGSYIMEYLPKYHPTFEL